MITGEVAPTNYSKAFTGREPFLDRLDFSAKIYSTSTGVIVDPAALLRDAVRRDLQNADRRIVLVPVPELRNSYDLTLSGHCVVRIKVRDRRVYVEGNPLALEAQNRFVCKSTFEYVRRYTEAISMCLNRMVTNDQITLCDSIIQRVDITAMINCGSPDIACATFADLKAHLRMMSCTGRDLSLVAAEQAGTDERIPKGAVRRVTIEDNTFYYGKDSKSYSLKCYRSCDTKSPALDRSCDKWIRLELTLRKEAIVLLKERAMWRPEKLSSVFSFYTARLFRVFRQYRPDRNAYMDNLKLSNKDAVVVYAWLAGADLRRYLDKEYCAVRAQILCVGIDISERPTPIRVRSHFYGALKLREFLDPSRIDNGMDAEKAKILHSSSIKLKSHAGAMSNKSALRPMAPPHVVTVPVQKPAVQQPPRTLLHPPIARQLAGLQNVVTGRAATRPLKPPTGLPPRRR